MCNYYFMFVSTFLITALGAWVTERMVEPAWANTKATEKPEEIKSLSASERRGLWFALGGAALFTALYWADSSRTGTSATRDGRHPEIALHVRHRGADVSGGRRSRASPTASGPAP
jgi:p-aminobenzoyl-glutamate transporter AbgT